MIAKAFHFSGRYHLELNLTQEEAKRLFILIQQILPDTMERQTMLTKLIKQISKGWKL